MEQKFCLNPEISVRGINPQDCTLFKSAMAPMRVCFEALNQQNEEIKYKIIYKRGDDLRQDQLIIQMFTLMDSLLKSVNQNMELSIYKVLATSKEDGFLEFVPNSRTLQDILKDKRNLTNYFKSLAKEISGVKMSDSKTLISPSSSKFDLNKTISDDDEVNSPSKGDLLKPGISGGLSTEKIEEKILDTYINSCAGYCVMTYFLGIGDRHLENVLLDNQGDIYYIFSLR